MFEVRRLGPASAALLFASDRAAALRGDAKWWAMPERLREIASLLRAFVGNRRYAPRYPVNLGASVSLLDGRGPARELVGHTRDISSCGVAVVLPAIRIGDRYLTGDSHVLAISIQLPSDELIQFHGVPVRYEPLSEDDSERGYVVGVKIKEISDGDRSRLNSFVKNLSRP